MPDSDHNGPASLLPSLSVCQGWVRLVDCQFALGQYAQAAETSRTALQKCPQIRVTSEFKSIVQALKKAGHDV